MTTIQLNIGLKTNTNKDLETFFTRDLVEFCIKNGFDVSQFEYALRDSNTEQTLIVKFKTMAHENHIRPRIKFLSNALQQDCIAMKVDDVGELVYSDEPKNDWGKFNQEYFIEI